MPPNGEKNDGQSVLLDLIRNLPENVIDEILMRLPLREAVRTSILSRKWRYDWSRLPQLNFDSAFWESTTKDCSTSPTTIFTDVIVHLLNLHQGPITKFALSIPYLRIRPRRRIYSKIDTLIDFLPRKGIQHLVLQLPVASKYKLPCSLFACSQMSHLTLENCEIDLRPPDFKRFDRLISLELLDVTICFEFLKSLISECPLLEKLELRFSEELEVLEINAPKLRCFEFIGNTGSLYLKNIPCLAKLSLCFSGYLEEALFICNIAKLFESCSALECLCVDNNTLKFFTWREGESV